MPARVVLHVERPIESVPQGMVRLALLSMDGEYSGTGFRGTSRGLDGAVAGGAEGKTPDGS